MATDYAGISARLERAMRQPHVSRVTVKAHPKQPLAGHGGFLSADESWEWGPEWQMGPSRRGRWATATRKDGSSFAARVEWDQSEPIVADWEMAQRAVRVLYAIPQVERDDAKAAMFAELTAFDAMCAELWERHER